MLALAAALLLQAPLPEGNSFVQRLLGRQRVREEQLNQYTYDVLETVEDLDGKGVVTKRESRRYEVFYVKGRPLRRLVAENGRPLPDSEQAKQDAKLRARAAAIAQGRVATEEVGPRLSAILERYDFRSVARESQEGRDTIVLEFLARPGKRDLDSDKLLRALQGKLWVDEADLAVVRAEVRNVAGIKWGFGLGASLKALEVEMRFRRMPDGVWLPLHVGSLASGRILLFKSFRKRTTVSYQGFKRFTVESEEGAVLPLQSKEGPP